jgi:hypothetical protein
MSPDVFEVDESTLDVTDDEDVDTDFLTAM